MHVNETVSTLALEDLKVGMLNKVRIFELQKIFKFEFVYDPSKFDFQILAGLNSAKSVLWLH